MKVLHTIGQRRENSNLSEIFKKKKKDEEMKREFNNNRFTSPVMGTKNH